MARTASPTIWAWISWATAGSVFFAGTWWVLQQDNSSIFFDDTNNRLGLMTTAPTHTLTLWSTGTGIAIYNTVDQTTNFERVRIQWASNRLDITNGSGWSGTARSLRVWANSSGGDTSWGTSYINYAPDNLTFNVRAWSAASLWHLFTVWANTSSSWTHTLVSITESVAQSGTWAYTWLLVNITETSTWSWAKNLLLAQIWWVTKFSVSNAGVVGIWNTVWVWVAVASTHKVTIDIWWTTYYLLASNV